MSDLSQEEIDALISGAIAEEGEQEAPSQEEGASDTQESEQNQAKPEIEIRGYDFKKPSPIPDEQKNTISLLHEQYAQKLQVNLSAFLRAEVEASLQSVEQITFSQYIKGLNTPTCISSFDMQPLNGFGLLEINAVIAYSMIDRMLGGVGEVPVKVRPFTGVEIAVLRKLVSTLLIDLGEMWKPIVNMEFHPQEIQTNPSMVRIIPMKEVTLIITLNVKVGDTSGLISICIPYSNLEPVAFKLSNQQWNKYTSQQSEAIQTAHRKNFLGVKLDVTAILESIDLKMRDVLNLQKGDIIDLGKKVKEPIVLRVAKEDKFRANPGLLGKHKACAIQSLMQKE